MMTNKIIEQLEEYFENSKQERSFGIQNFQGVREYTKIPLAPLTLVYGQNSAGKSTIHDAQQFIHGFFSGEWDCKLTAEYLERWANHNRHSEPLIKGYLGEADDVVISIGSVTGEMDYFEWEAGYHQNQDYITDGIANTLFTSNIDNNIPFQVFFHFSNKSHNSTWFIRQVSLYLGDKQCLELVFNEHNCTLKINRSHLVYALIDSVFEGGIDKLVGESMEENIFDPDFLVFSNIDGNNELRWTKPISWVQVDCSGIRPSSDVLELRTFLLSLLIIPTKSIASDFEFSSVAPLRPIPSKQTAVFRCSLDSPKNSTGWLGLAEQVGMKAIAENYPVDQPIKDDLGFSNLDAMNRMLSHPMFLNTDYEVTGNCLFFTPIGAFSRENKSNEEMRELLRHFEVEVHLKLRNKNNGSLVEIEDVGVGISQIIPVLNSIIEGGQVFIQQPELHLHPKLQAQLADAFIECMNKSWSNFIVESHSEHLLLRFLRRIRETNNSDIKSKLFGLTTEQISVLYVDKLEDGSSKIVPLRLSAEGEFIDRWPHGFFTERDGDLFDE
jgi:predicted ATPase